MIVFRCWIRIYFDYINIRREGRVFITDRPAVLPDSVDKTNLLLCVYCIGRTTVGRPFTGAGASCFDLREDQMGVVAGYYVDFVMAHIHIPAENRIAVFL